MRALLTRSSSRLILAVGQNCEADPYFDIVLPVGCGGLYDKPEPGWE